MAVRWVLIFLFVLSVFEPALLEQHSEVPMSVSLGYSIHPSIEDKDDSQLRKYQEMYEEMLKVSRESFQKLGQDEAKLETVVGWQRAKSMKRGVTNHRRIAADLRSPILRRRVRSQRTRREKLDSQGLRNHQQHIRLIAGHEPQSTPPYQGRG